jgi:hypothetical protein
VVCAELLSWRKSRCENRYFEPYPEVIGETPIPTHPHTYTHEWCREASMLCKVFMRACACFVSKISTELIFRHLYVYSGRDIPNQQIIITWPRKPRLHF